MSGGGKAALIRPRMRVILDNDWGGDPDGLFQLAHHLLSPSVSVRAIVGSHLHAGETWGRDEQQAQVAARLAEKVVQLTGFAERIPIVAGAESAIADRNPPRSVAADAIIAEAMRDDDTRQLYYCAGAGLTDLATAWLHEPRIAERVILIWIGGPEYPGDAYTPVDTGASEYNLSMDIKAAQLIFGESAFEIWQVPRNAYRQLMVSYTELLARVAPCGALGRYLADAIERAMAFVDNNPQMRSLGETYILGDSPLVTLTALQSSFHPDPSSCRYELRPTPRIDDTGEYITRADGRPIRVYTQIDKRLTFEDFCLKLRR
jgi:inosine-uridine nucleoside N-ribohydrolase